MDISTFNRAKQAYDARDWETAALLFSACMSGPGAGEAAHLRGNALMRLGRVREAVQAYQVATADTSYANRGAVFTNLGKAQVALGDYSGAITSLRQALDDPSYTGAYKALLALGGAYSKLGDARNAGVAYRKAALEENNPDPAKALINLGVCFVQLHRPADAAEAYRTALDFSQDANERNMIQANLGQAYVASNRMIEAVQAFNAAISNGYQLTAPAQADYQRALMATNSLAGAAGAPGSGSTADFLSGYGAQGGMDPLDPLGRSGEVMPSPDESGFFDITDEDIEAASKAHKASAKAAGKAQGGSRHVGLKILVALLAIVVAALIACVALYLQGFGVPSQQVAVDGVFETAAAGQDGGEYWASSVPAQAQRQAVADVPQGSTHEIAGMDVSSSSSTALVTVTLPEGGELTFNVSLVREGIGWKVSNVEREQLAVDADTYTDATAAPLTSTVDTPAPADPAAAEGAPGEEQPVEGDPAAEPVA